jgi:hypothetical protein
MGRGATRTNLVGRLALLAALSIGAFAAAHSEAASPTSPPTRESVAALALQWFVEMQAGKIDRSQYASAYSAQLTDSAVRDMSRHLNQYGAAPIGADVVRIRKIDDQTFYVVKILFPRGDATGLLLGLDTAGKITGIDIVSMAGD